MLQVLNKDYKEFSLKKCSGLLVRAETKDEAIDVLERYNFNKDDYKLLGLVVHANPRVLRLSNEDFELLVKGASIQDRRKWMVLMNKNV